MASLWACTSEVYTSNHYHHLSLHLLYINYHFSSLASVLSVLALQSPPPIVCSSSSSHSQPFNLHSFMFATPSHISPDRSTSRACVQSSAWGTYSLLPSALHYDSHCSKSYTRGSSALHRSPASSWLLKLTWDSSAPADGRDTPES